MLARSFLFLQLTRELALLLDTKARSQAAVTTVAAELAAARAGKQAVLSATLSERVTHVQALEPIDTAIAAARAEFAAGLKASFAPAGDDDDDDDGEGEGGDDGPGSGNLTEEQEAEARTAIIKLDKRIVETEAAITGLHATTQRLGLVFKHMLAQAAHARGRTEGLSLDELVDLFASDEAWKYEMSGILTHTRAETRGAEAALLEAEADLARLRQRLAEEAEAARVRARALCSDIREVLAAIEEAGRQGAALRGTAARSLGALFALHVSSGCAQADMLTRYADMLIRHTRQRGNNVAVSVAIAKFRRGMRRGRGRGIGRGRGAQRRQFESSRPELEHELQADSVSEAGSEAEADAPAIARAAAAQQRRSSARSSGSSSTGAVSTSDAEVVTKVTINHPVPATSMPATSAASRGGSGSGSSSFFMTAGDDGDEDDAKDEAKGEAKGEAKDDDAYRSTATASASAHTVTSSFPSRVAVAAEPSRQVHAASSLHRDATTAGARASTSASTLQMQSGRTPAPASAARSAAVSLGLTATLSPRSAARAAVTYACLPPGHPDAARDAGAAASETSSTQRAATTSGRQGQGLQGMGKGKGVQLLSVAAVAAASLRAETGSRESDSELRSTAAAIGLMATTPSARTVTVDHRRDHNRAVRRHRRQSAGSDASSAAVSVASHGEDEHGRDNQVTVTHCQASATSGSIAASSPGPGPTPRLPLCVSPSSASEESSAAATPPDSEELHRGRAEDRDEQWHSGGHWQPEGERRHHGASRSGGVKVTARHRGRHRNRDDSESESESEFDSAASVSPVSTASAVSGAGARLAVPAVDDIGPDGNALPEPEVTMTRGRQHPHGHHHGSADHRDDVAYRGHHHGRHHDVDSDGSCDGHKSSESLSDSQPLTRSATSASSAASVAGFASSSTHRRGQRDHHVDDTIAAEAEAEAEATAKADDCGTGCGASSSSGSGLPVPLPMNTGRRLRPTRIPHTTSAACGSDSRSLQSGASSTDASGGQRYASASAGSRATECRSGCASGCCSQCGSRGSDRSSLSGRHGHQPARGGETSFEVGGVQPSVPSGCRCHCHGSASGLASGFGAEAQPSLKSPDRTSAIKALAGSGAAGLGAAEAQAAGGAGLEATSSDDNDTHTVDGCSRARSRSRSRSTSRQQQLQQRLSGPSGMGSGLPSGLGLPPKSASAAAAVALWPSPSPSPSPMLRVRKVSLAAAAEHALAATATTTVTAHVSFYETGSSEGKPASRAAAAASCDLDALFATSGSGASVVEGGSHCAASLSAPTASSGPGPHVRPGPPTLLDSIEKAFTDAAARRRPCSADADAGHRSAGGATIDGTASSGSDCDGEMSHSHSESHGDSDACSSGSFDSDSHHRHDHDHDDHDDHRDGTHAAVGKPSSSLAQASSPLAASQRERGRKRGSGKKGHKAAADSRSGSRSPSPVDRLSGYRRGRASPSRCTLNPEATAAVLAAAEPPLPLFASAAESQLRRLSEAAPPTLPLMPAEVDTVLGEVEAACHELFGLLAQLLRTRAGRHVTALALDGAFGPIPAASMSATGDVPPLLGGNTAMARLGRVASMARLRSLSLSPAMFKAKVGEGSALRDGISSGNASSTNAGTGVGRQRSRIWQRRLPLRPSRPDPDSDPLILPAPGLLPPAANDLWGNPIFRLPAGEVAYMSVSGAGMLVEAATATRVPPTASLAIASGHHVPHSGVGSIAATGAAPSALSLAAAAAASFGHGHGHGHGHGDVLPDAGLAAVWGGALPPVSAAGLAARAARVVAQQSSQHASSEASEAGRDRDRDRDGSIHANSLSNHGQSNDILLGHGGVAGASGGALPTHIHARHDHDAEAVQAQAVAAAMVDLLPFRLPSCSDKYGSDGSPLPLSHAGTGAGNATGSHTHMQAGNGSSRSGAASSLASGSHGGPGSGASGGRRGRSGSVQSASPGQTRGHGHGHGYGASSSSGAGSGTLPSPVLASLGLATPESIRAEGQLAKLDLFHGFLRLSTGAAPHGLKGHYGSHASSGSGSALSGTGAGMQARGKPAQAGLLAYAAMVSGSSPELLPRASRSSGHGVSELRLASPVRHR